MLALSDGIDLRLVKECNYALDTCTGARKALEEENKALVEITETLQEQVIKHEEKDNSLGYVLVAIGGILLGGALVK